MLFRLFRPVILSALTLAILAYFLPTVSIGNFTALLLASLILTFLQKFIKPLLKLIFLPINIVTLGLFSLALNIFLLWLLTYLVPGFQIEAMTLMGVPLNQAFSLLFASALISLLQSLLKLLI